MGFGGGASPSENIPATVDTALSLIILGMDDDGDEGTQTWADAVKDSATSDTFGTDPSLLRWIRAIGLTDSGGNPYQNFNIYSPESAIARYRASVDALYDDATSNSMIINGYDIGKQIFDNTVGRVDIEDFIAQSSVLASADVRTGVIDLVSNLPTDIFDDLSKRVSETIISRQRTRKEAAIKELNDRYAFNGLSGSSGMLLGRALVEREFETEIIAAETQLSVSLYQQAATDFLQGFLNLLSEYLRTFAISKSQEHERVIRYQSVVQQDRVLKLQAAQLYGASIAQEVEALSGFNSNEIELKVRETLWDPEILQSGANAVAAFSGAVIPQPRPSRGQITLGAAFTGAGIGAEVGGPKGAIIGGAAGLLGGALGLFD